MFCREKEIFVIFSRFEFEIGIYPSISEAKATKIFLCIRFRNYFHEKCIFEKYKNEPDRFQRTQ
jgi:hypothetical protein